MDLSKDQVSNKSYISYQKQKLYIEDLEVNEDIDSFEKDLKFYLSKYGSIIDIKLLKNRKLRRS